MDGTPSGLLARNPWVARRKIDVFEYHLMGEAGILGEDDRVELIEGELVAMAPIGSDHSGTVNALTELLILAVGRRGVVSPQNPVRLDNYSEPQPDFTVLKPRADRYRRAHPVPGDVLLVIEVAKSSFAYDRDVKLPLYARHGIPEVWIVDIEADAIHVARGPGAEGYAEMRRAVRGDILEPSALPGVRIAVSDVLG